MIIIIGLGNPGEKFKNTRHNVGFMAVDEFARKNSFPEFTCLPAGRNYKKNPLALVSQQGNILLAKPQTFMNESGKAAKELIKNISLENIIVVHDDIDLPVGKIKIIKERGSAGHKGVESIIKNIGNDGLIRLRIGIAPQKKVSAMDIVLENFSDDEQEIIKETLQKTVEALDLLVEEGLEKAMNRFNA